MKTGLKISLWILLTLGWLYLVNLAMGLLNKSSDLAVFGGVVSLLALLVVAIGAIGRFGKKAFQKVKEVAVKRNILMMLLVGVMLIGATACTRVGPGYVGIKVSMAGDNRGVNDLPMRTGWVFYMPGASQVFEYPTFVQTASWTRDPHEGSPNNEEISFNTKEGLIVTGDISLSYQLKASMVPAFYVKFRSDNLENFTHGYLRNVARDAFNEVGGKYSVEDIYGPKKEEFLAAVLKKVNDNVGSVGVEIQQFGFIGAPRPPQNVIDAINSKIAATQNAMRAENEIKQAEAEAKKAIAKAEGEAKANEILTKSLNENLIKWKNLELTQKAIDKWDGHRPMVEGANAGILMSISPNK